MTLLISLCDIFSVMLNKIKIIITQSGLLIRSVLCGNFTSTWISIILKKDFYITGFNGYDKQFFGIKSD